jgi:hypothetical protein
MFRVFWVALAMARRDGSQPGKVARKVGTDPKSS